MNFCIRLLIPLTLGLTLSLFSSCATTSSSSARAGLLGGPTRAERAAQISSEPKGSFFYGRRYYVQKTRFWGYIRKPGQSGFSSKLVMMNESSIRVPDRLPEKKAGKSYGYDANYEYRVFGRFTGSKAYDPNSNQFLPEFLPTKFELISSNPGWLFTPNDRYNPRAITMRPGVF